MLLDYSSGLELYAWVNSQIRKGILFFRVMHRFVELSGLDLFFFSLSILVSKWILGAIGIFMLVYLFFSLSWISLSCICSDLSNPYVEKHFPGDFLERFDFPDSLR